MRKIIWGEYPELTGKDSKFIENPDELDYVFDYAWKYSGYKDLYGGDDEPDIWEASLSAVSWSISHRWKLLLNQAVQLP